MVPGSLHTVGQTLNGVWRRRRRRRGVFEEVGGAVVSLREADVSLRWRLGLTVGDRLVPKAMARLRGGAGRRRR